MRVTPCELRLPSRTQHAQGLGRLWLGLRPYSAAGKRIVEGSCLDSLTSDLVTIKRQAPALNMAPVNLEVRVRRVGHSLAILLPARTVRESNLRAGQRVLVSLEPKVPEPLGLLKDLRGVPLGRRQEGLWRDRI